MELLERDVLSRSPLISTDNDAVFRYTAEVMGEFIAIHPFREGNGRTAFVLGNLVLMQNDLLPLDVYDRRRDEGALLRGVRSGAHSQGLRTAGRTH